MKSSDADILLIPGWSGSGPDHWQSRWEARLPTARRVAQEDWYKPSRQLWAERIVEAVRAATRPVVLVAHSAGCSAVAFAAEHLHRGEVAGGFLVAPASERAKGAVPGMGPDFIAHRRETLPFRSVLIASANDPYCTHAEARDLAEAWGSEFVDAGDSGHLNSESGHGPWPDGLLRFAGFLKSLGAVPERSIQ
ncbi:alpha/beta hydrolase [Bosea sp. (in: a-proteobacteria)]|uniref:RBBP9/YdeN family alpha/beta hydrolase n=1 Tax=Bosea sp. (in: a-proteobacteria) TaxID=1871050 RepID=UPI0026027CB9|nr:alpha/beta hydrolase [Bosea sp. (in: a-proteobacteria)]MCO5092226.1 alpha/beta hydrolase [Bosea sp. (in: a-proteobacteria)]